MLRRDRNPVTENMPQEHPRKRTGPPRKAGNSGIWLKPKRGRKMYSINWRSGRSIYRLTDVQPTWLLSRLVMYWKSHATEAYACERRLSDHAGGKKVLYPTVRYTGIAREQLPPRASQVGRCSALWWWWEWGTWHFVIMYHRPTIGECIRRNRSEYRKFNCEILE